jgi:curved DNA-binding protein CbpA
MDHMEICTKDIENSHATLGLRPFAKEDEIRSAWRSKVSQAHPDHGGSADAFRLIQQAAELLLKEGAREYYEAESCRIAANGAPTQTPAPPYGHKAKRTSGSKPSEPKVQRRPELLAAAILGCFFAPHFRQFGLTWTPIREIGEVMHLLDWVCLAGWLRIKKVAAD